MDSGEWPTVAEVVGMNARRIRGSHRIDEVATSARTAGLSWGTGRVSELEAGKVSATLPTLLALCMALANVTGKPVGLSDLVTHPGRVRINREISMRGDELVSAVSGEPSDWRADDGDFGSLLKAIAVRQAGGEAEQRAAQSLGVSGGEFQRLAVQLWGRSYSEERDARAGADANAQKRGQIARQLKSEMREALKG